MAQVYHKIEPTSGASHCGVRNDLIPSHTSGQQLWSGIIRANIANNLQIEWENKLDPSSLLTYNPGHSFSPIVAKPEKRYTFEQAGQNDGIFKCELSLMSLFSIEFNNTHICIG